MKNDWTIKVFFITFLLAAIFSVIANLLGKLNNFILVAVTLLVLLIGIVFDCLGTAALSCDIKVFHSKASQKIKGSKEAINLAKNNAKVSSICNDIVGDICGIISGSLLTILIINLFASSNLTLYNIIFTAVLSSLTVGGKALGKTYAVNNGNDIIFKAGHFLNFFTKKD